MIAPSQSALPPPHVPAARDDLPWWRARHQAILERLRPGEIDLVFAGDSHFQMLEHPAAMLAWRPPSVWDRHYAPRHAINLGFQGDTTGNLLWRLNNGEVDGLRPRAVLVQIGANDVGRPGATAAATADAIGTVIATLRELLPAAGILLLGVLPGERPPRLARMVAEVNRSLASRYSGSDAVTVLDMDAPLQRDGALDRSLFVTEAAGAPVAAKHLNATGQERMAQAIEPALQRLLEPRP